MVKVLNFLSGVILGAAAGAAAGLLFSPQSGEDLQQSFRDRVQEAVAEGKAAQVAKQAELERQAGIRSA